MEARSIEYKITVDTNQAQAVLGSFIGLMKEAENESGNYYESLKDLGYGFRNAAKDASHAGKKFDAVKKPLGGLLDQFKRILRYRVLRGIISGIANGFSEGVKNMYQWNKALGGEFAAAMDSLASSALTFKNSLAVASAPLIEWLAPRVATLAAWFADLATNVSRFFAILTGADHYYQATTASVTAYGNAAGSAAKKVRTLLKFDEINRLERKNQGSGSGGSGGYSGGGFEEKPLEVDVTDMDIWARLTLAFQELGIDLGNIFSGDTFISKLAQAGTKLGLTWLGFKALGFGKLGLTLGAISFGIDLAKIAIDALGIKNDFAQALVKGLGAIVGGLLASVVLGPGAIAIGALFALGIIAKSVSTDTGKVSVSEWWSNFTSTFSNWMRGKSNTNPRWGSDGKLSWDVWSKPQVNVTGTTTVVPQETKTTFIDVIKSFFGVTTVDNTTTVNVTKADPKMPGSTENYWKDKIAQMFNDTQVNASVTVNVKDVVVKKGRDPVPPVYEMSDLHTSLSRVSIGKTNMAAMSVSQGDLFMANEAGVEMVGRVGSRTATANNDQIIQGITNGVANANQQQNALLREQNAILRQLLNKGTNITTGSLSSAFERANRREGSTIIAVGG